MNLLRLVFLVAVSLFVTITCNENARFDGHQVYRVFVDYEDQLRLLQSIEGDFDFWKAPLLGRHADIRIRPEQFDEFNALMEAYEIRSELAISNVQSLIDNENVKSVDMKDGSFDFGVYHKLAEIYAWLDEQLEIHSNVLTAHTVGYSFEGRTIRAVKLSHKKGNPIVFLDANIHAREWITSASAIWILNELLTSTDPDVQDLAQNIDWVVVPVINVDGFQYTHTSFRLWRKTRQPHSTLCYGADPNRNFNATWMLIGASNNPCSGTFAGPRPFSEPETRALATFIESLGDRVKVYLSLHSYSQLVLFPHGHSTENAPDFDALSLIGLRTASAIKERFGTEYNVGAPPVILYATSGASMDWAYQQNITLSYTFELRDTGKHGFVLPADQIVPTARELLDGFIEFVKAARELNQL